MATEVTKHKIKLKNTEIVYSLKRSSRSRHVRITIHPQNGLVVSSPPRYPQSKIEDFLKQKAYWITSKLRIVMQNQKQKFIFKSGSKVTFLGQDYKIKILDTEELRPQIELKTANLIVSTPLGNLKQAEAFFTKWLERFTKQTIEERVGHYAKKHKLKYNHLVIKNQQTVWGSCSSKKNLNFSKRLIQIPMWLIDYVVSHELAHLTQMNHSQKFWDQVGEYYPDYKRARRYLRAFQPNVKLE